MAPHTTPRPRGRPSAASIPFKILEGEQSDSKFKCEFCNRDFPRNKSLQAHRKVHTGEKPYKCDFPGCNEKFRQSGHLRSHVYLHSGENPFICPAEGCSKRFHHPNRRCLEHELLKLVRDGNETIREDIENLTPEQAEWLENYKAKKLAKVPVTKRESRKRKLSTIDEEAESNPVADISNDANGPSREGAENAAREDGPVPVTKRESKRRKLSTMDENAESNPVAVIANDADGPSREGAENAAIEDGPVPVTKRGRKKRKLCTIGENAESNPVADTANDADEPSREGAENAAREDGPGIIDNAEQPAAMQDDQAAANENANPVIDVMDRIDIKGACCLMLLKYGSGAFVYFERYGF